MKNDTKSSPPQIPHRLSDQRGRKTSESAKNAKTKEKSKGSSIAQFFTACLKQALRTRLSPEGGVMSQISLSWRLELWNRDHVTYHVIASSPCVRPLKTLRAPRTPVNLDLPSLVLN